MAVATGTALALGALGLQGAGMGYNAFQQSQAARQQNERMDAILQAAAGLRQNGPSSVEQQLLELYGQGFQGTSFTPSTVDLSSLLSGSGYNTGQDALLQMLRATPDSNLNRSLNSIIEGGGNPFDTSSLFAALGEQDQRNTNNQVAGLRGGSGGLGERFGSAMLGAETALRQGISTDINARNAQIQSSSYESAQSRLLQAAGQLAQRDQFTAGLADTLRRGGLDIANLFMENNQANNAASAQAASMNQQNRNFGAQLLQLLLGAEQSRNAFNLQTLGLGAGMQTTSPQYGFGNAASDFGQLLMFLQMMGGGGAGGKK